MKSARRGEEARKRTRVDDTTKQCIQLNISFYLFDYSELHVHVESLVFINRLRALHGWRDITEGFSKGKTQVTW